MALNDAKRTIGIAPVTALTWVSARPDGALVAVGDEKGVIYLWSPAKRNVVARQELGARVTRLEWTADGKHLLACAAGTDALSIYSADGTTLDASIPTGHEPLTSFCVHPSRPMVVTCGGEHVRVFDLDTLDRVREMKEPSRATCVAVSEDRIVAGWQSGWFTSWMFDSGEKAGGGELYSNANVGAMAFSRDGRSLLTGGGGGGLIELVQSADSWVAGETWKTIPPKPIATNAIAFDANGRFVCAHSDDTCSVFKGSNDRTPSELGRAFWLDKKPWTEAFIVSSACFLPGTKQILSTHFSGELQLWDEDGVWRMVSVVALD